MITTEYLALMGIICTSSYQSEFKVLIEIMYIYLLLISVKKTILDIGYFMFERLSQEENSIWMKFLYAFDLYLFCAPLHFFKVWTNFI